jgi:flavin-dependent thymidylate synthase
MKVSLIDYTGAGTANPTKYAAAQLVFAKNTRLEMNAGLLNEIYNWDDNKIYTELEYIANTIPSSWEFVHYTFLIEGVSRGFTHQFVRTRTASFAQQTMRVLNVSTGKGWDYHTGPSIEESDHKIALYNTAMETINNGYKQLIKAGAKVEDARGVLPTNILTNIMVSMNLRTLTEMIRKRSSPRTQGEYRSVLEGLKTSTLDVHPWARLFFDRTFDKAAKELDDEIKGLDISNEKRMHMMKLIDQMRGQS